jgi:hypothetical protein
LVSSTAVHPATSFHGGEPRPVRRSGNEGVTPRPRAFFDVDEARMRARVYLHAGLDLEAAEQFWSELTGVPREQFRQPYRATADPSIRRNKHEHGCVYVYYCCSTTHRRIMGLVRALLVSSAIPG